MNNNFKLTPAEAFVLHAVGGAIAVGIMAVPPALAQFYQTGQIDLLPFLQIAGLAFAGACIGSIYASIRLNGFQWVRAMYDAVMQIHQATVVQQQQAATPPAAPVVPQTSNSVANLPSQLSVDVSTGYGGTAIPVQLTPAPSLSAVQLVPAPAIAVSSGYGDTFIPTQPASPPEDHPSLDNVPLSNTLPNIGVVRP